MSFEFYKILHIVGLICLFIGLAAVLILAYTGQMQNARAKMIGFAMHGLGLFLILFSGFGMAAKLQIFMAMPGWLYGKIAIWVLLALAVSLLKRKPQWALFNLLLIVALGATAAGLALLKPF